MEVQLNKITIEQKETLQNLMQFYFYDFSEMTGADVHMNGSFGVYPNLNNYFYKKETHDPYFLYQDDTLAGFALVKQLEDKNAYAIGEFFVLRKFRRSGMGFSAAKQVLQKYPGNWEIFQMEKNVPALHFWRKVISDATNGNYEERMENGRVTQTFTV